ncbi:MAG: hypothetical protein ASARMPRED_002367 [Alectoria sarmentosa]|nr:MAG: hypothetical protein ASARMPRED_002367 [Alectoria sarmentosa]
MNNHSSPISANSIRRRVSKRTPGKKTMRWDTEADQQLLFAILAAHEVKIDFEAVASKLGDHSQDDSAPSDPMPNVPPVKKRKRVVLGEHAATNNEPAADGSQKSAQAQVSATGSMRAGSGFKEVLSTGRSPSRSIATGDSVEKKGKSSRRVLLPIKKTQTLGTSHAQLTMSTGQVLLEKRSQDSPHKVKIFSSQKIPQPFLDR